MYCHRTAEIPEKTEEDYLRTRELGVDKVNYRTYTVDEVEINNSSNENIFRNKLN